MLQSSSTENGSRLHDRGPTTGLIDAIVSKSGRPDLACQVLDICRLAAYWFKLHLAPDLLLIR